MGDRAVGTKIIPKAVVAASIVRILSRALHLGFVPLTVLQLDWLCARLGLDRPAALTLAQELCSASLVTRIAEPDGATPEHTGFTDDRALFQYDAGIAAVANKMASAALAKQMAERRARAIAAASPEPVVSAAPAAATSPASPVVVESVAVDGPAAVEAVSPGAASSPASPAVESTPAAAPVAAAAVRVVPAEPASRAIPAPVTPKPIPTVEVTSPSAPPPAILRSPVSVASARSAGSLAYDADSSPGSMHEPQSVGSTPGVATPPQAVRVRKLQLPDLGAVSPVPVTPPPTLAAAPRTEAVVPMTAPPSVRVEPKTEPKIEPSLPVSAVRLPPPPVPVPAAVTVLAAATAAVVTPSAGSQPAAVQVSPPEPSPAPLPVPLPQPAALSAGPAAYAGAPSLVAVIPAHIASDPVALMQHLASLGITGALAATATPPAAATAAPAVAPATAGAAPASGGMVPAATAGETGSATPGYLVAPPTRPPTRPLMGSVPVPEYVRAPAVAPLHADLPSVVPGFAAPGPRSDRHTPSHSAGATMRDVSEVLAALRAEQEVTRQLGGRSGVVRPGDGRAGAATGVEVPSADLQRRYAVPTSHADAQLVRPLALSLVAFGLVFC
jgi:hypothetical protein